MHYVPLMLKDYDNAIAYPCISLLKCLSLSHPSIFGWASLYLSLISLVAQHFLVASCFASFQSLSLLALISVLKLSRREWGFHVVHSILLCKSYFVHVPWGALSWLFRTLGWSYHNIFLCPFGIRILWLLASFF